MVSSSSYMGDSLIHVLETRSRFVVQARPEVSL